MINKYIVRSSADKKFEISFDPVSKTLSVNGDPVELDISGEKNEYHVLFQHKSYEVFLVNVDEQNNNCTVSINGNIVQLHVEDHYETLLKELGMDNLSHQVIKEIRAPMPGLVLDTMVEVGNEVAEGQTLLILEAMKMENNISSPNEGIVKEVLAKKGQTVDKNAVLIRFE